MMASLSAWVKPATGTKGNNHACTGSSGVLEDSAYVKGSTRNLGDPYRCEMQHLPGMHNRQMACKEVGGVHSSGEVG